MISRFLHSRAWKFSWCIQFLCFKWSFAHDYWTNTFNSQSSSKKIPTFTPRTSLNPWFTHIDVFSQYNLTMQDCADCWLMHVPGPRSTWHKFWDRLDYAWLTIFIILPITNQHPTSVLNYVSLVQLYQIHISFDSGRWN